MKRDLICVKQVYSFHDLPEVIFPDMLDKHEDRIRRAARHKYPGGEFIEDFRHKILFDRDNQVIRVTTEVLIEYLTDLDLEKIKGVPDTKVEEESEKLINRFQAEHG